jgi:hypothetical protein
VEVEDKRMAARLAIFDDEDEANWLILNYTEISGFNQKP